MADIKTRQSNKGTIRTIDRASAMTSHIKDVHARTKEDMLHSKEQSREQASSQATDQMGQMAGRSVRTVAAYSADSAKAGYHRVRSKESVLRRQTEQKMAGKEAARTAPVIRTRETAFASRGKRVSRPLKTVRKPHAEGLRLAKRQYQMQKHTQRVARRSR